MVRRYLSEEVELGLTDNPVLMLVGPRQCGKSTLVLDLPDREYVTLDDPTVLGAVDTNPSAWLDGITGPLTIDEVQRAPGLFLPLKLRIDRNRTSGKYVLTGSANVLAMPKVADSLAGRMEVIDLLPLSQAEMEGRSGNFIEWAFGEEPYRRGTWEPNELIERIIRGGFPQPALARSPERRNAWAESYIRTMLDRDVRDLAQIEGLRQIPQIFRLIAARSGSNLNMDSMSRDSGIPASTLRRYLDLLHKLYLTQYVPAYSGSQNRRILKSPKVFLVDTLLTTYALNLTASNLRRDRNLLGSLLEGFVANELARIRTYSKIKPTLFHLRTSRSHEVDFVLESGDGRIVGIEIKSSTSLVPSDFNGLKFLQELAGERFHRGIVLHDGTTVSTVSREIASMPVSALWNLEPLLG
jgi:predicted AAA+ superfamily ATPase